MSRPSYFASLVSPPDRHTPAQAAALPASPALPPEQAERLAHLFRLSRRTGQVHPLAHMLERYRASQQEQPAQETPR